MAIPSASRLRPRRSASASTAHWSLLPSTSTTARGPAPACVKRLGAIRRARPSFASSPSLYARDRGAQPVSALHPLEAFQLELLGLDRQCALVQPGCDAAKRFAAEQDLSAGRGSLQPSGEV